MFLKKKKKNTRKWNKKIYNRGKQNFFWEKSIFNIEIFLRKKKRVSLLYTKLSIFYFFIANPLWILIHLTENKNIFSTLWVRLFRNHLILDSCWLKISISISKAKKDKIWSELYGINTSLLQTSNSKGNQNRSKEILFKIFFLRRCFYNKIYLATLSIFYQNPKSQFILLQISKWSHPHFPTRKLMVCQFFTASVCLYIFYGFFL